jgi:hypothetical protein
LDSGVGVVLPTVLGAIDLLTLLSPPLLRFSFAQTFARTIRAFFLLRGLNTEGAAKITVTTSS